MYYTTKQVSQKTGISTNALCRYAQKIGVMRGKRYRRFLWKLDDILKAKSMYRRPDQVRLLGQSDLLDTLQAVAECGSYAEAGRQMYLHHAAVLYRIKRLTKQHGRPLVEAKGKFGVELTDDGRRLLTEERPMWEESR